MRISITRKATGKTEEFDLVSTLNSEQDAQMRKLTEKENGDGGNPQHGK